MNEMREIKCETCPRVCPEDYQKMVEHCSRACQERDAAQALLRREQEAHRWIPVAERLPGFHKALDEGEDELYESDYVLVCDNKGNIFVACFISSRGDTYWVEMLDGEEIEGETYWMPLPEPPEVAHA